MRTQQPFFVVTLKAAGYGFNPIGLSKCNIWVTAKWYSAHLISSVAQEFSGWHQHLQLAGVQWQIKARLQVYFAPSWWSTLTPETSESYICTTTQCFSIDCLCSYWDIAQDPNKTELAHPGKLPSNNRFTYQTTTYPKHLKARLIQ